MNLKLLTASLLTLGLTTALDIKTTHSVECSRKTTVGDTVHMHYRGRLASTNKEFDSSYGRGKPLVFPVGRGVVIRGYFCFLLCLFLRLIVNAKIDTRWDEGLLDMCVGDKRTLTIPPEYGYGERGIGPIPGGATLVFDTELVGIDGVKKDEL